ncbi:hypothetical protein BDK88_3808 [Natrinema hispanicum]|uniref:Uncharacterized protein n=1 Tax=Natrinema hispanicum TaxID=392421 RepID=A0A482Y2J1_9EURY|nr:hypothetical protein BDK88_3808 [Natrinema hispanicum]
METDSVIVIVIDRPRLFDGRPSETAASVDSATRPLALVALLGKTELLCGIFCDDPPVDVLLGMAALDVFTKLFAGIEVVATEITAMVVMLWRHRRSTTAVPMNKGGIVTTETVHTPIARGLCDRVCSDFQWL